MTIARPSYYRHDLDELLAAAMARYDAMTPAERLAMWRAQRRSVVIGDMLLGDPTRTREEVERLVDDVLEREGRP